MADRNSSLRHRKGDRMPTESSNEQEKISEAKRIVDVASNVGVVLRLIGGLAIRNHCVITFFCEREYLDIDFVGLGRQIKGINELFKRLGYQENRSMWLVSAGNQLQFYKHDVADHVDVFLDMLRMEHDLVLRDRLEIEAYTVSVSDLLLSKLLIYRLNEKDVRDIVTLVKDLTLGEDDRRGVINVKYVARLCSDDWGVCVDVLANIGKCMGLMGNYNLTAEEAEKVRNSLLQIKETIEKEPKTFRWKLRKIVGARMPLRRRVEDESMT